MYHFDELKGNDETADGSAFSPYKTLVAIYIQHGNLVSAVSAVRPAAEDGPVSWEAATKSATKKANKLFEQYQAKQHKAEAARLKDEQSGAAKREAEQKKLDEAKSIVLVEPSSSAERIKIKSSVEKRGRRVRIFGWVHRLRTQGGMTFVVLRDGTGYIQCVLSGDLVSTFPTQYRTAAKSSLTADHRLPHRPRRTTPSRSRSSRRSRSPARSTSCQRVRLPSTTTSCLLTGGLSSARRPEETRPSSTRCPR